MKAIDIGYYELYIPATQTKISNIVKTKIEHVLLEHPQKHKGSLACYEPTHTPTKQETTRPQETQETSIKIYIYITHFVLENNALFI